jgi:hypothetical protein
MACLSSELDIKALGVCVLARGFVFDFAACFFAMGFFLGAAFCAAFLATGFFVTFFVCFAAMIFSLLKNVFRYPTDGVVSLLTALPFLGAAGRRRKSSRRGAKNAEGCAQFPNCALSSAPPRAPRDVLLNLNTCRHSSLFTSHFSGLG